MVRYTCRRQKGVKTMAEKEIKHRRVKGEGTIYEFKKEKYPYMRKRFKATEFLGMEVDENGQKKRKYHCLGYFATRPEAAKALQNRKDIIDNKKITFKEVYDLFYKAKYTDNGKINPHHDIYIKKAKDIWHTPIYKLRLEDLERLDKVKGTLPKDFHKRMGELLRAVFKYAVDHDIITTNYANRLTWNGNKEAEIDPEVRQKQIESLTPAFLAKSLLLQPDSMMRDYIQILMYTGCRPGELTKPINRYGIEKEVPIKIEDIDLKALKMVGGSKTEAGKHREIPIHPNIYEVVKRWYDDAIKCGRDTLMPYTPTTMMRKYKEQLPELYAAVPEIRAWRAVMQSQCEVCGLSKDIVESIVGHAPDTIRKKHYLRFTFEQKFNELIKLNYKYEVKPFDYKEKEKKKEKEAKEQKKEYTAQLIAYSTLFKSDRKDKWELLDRLQEVMTRALKEADETATAEEIAERALALLTNR